jgi:hypothetical protein
MMMHGFANVKFTYILLLIFKIIKNAEIVLATIKLFCRGILSKYCVVAVYTAFKYLCNLASTDYELPEDDTGTTRGGVIKSSIINC